MDLDNDHEVENVLEYNNSPLIQSGVRDQWASSSQATSLPNFLSNWTMQSICTHQVHIAMLQVNMHSWELAGVKLHSIQC
jgi:hypothetical protein